MRVAVSGLVTPHSGIGVLQRELYPRLEAFGLDLVEMPSREPQPGLFPRASALARGALARLPRNIDHFLSLVTPFLLTVNVPTTTLVYDLRWMRQRSGISGLYRAVDLKRAIRHSDNLVAISERTSQELIEFHPGIKPKVAHLGPGQMTTSNFLPSSSRDIMLIGSAPHKRNELAAELIATMPAGWAGEIFGVNVSSETITKLEGALGTGRCHWFHQIPKAKLMEVYRRCGISFQLSVDEGFGLPFIEALTAGHTVVAIDQPLTREVLGSAAILLREEGVSDMASQLVGYPLPDVSVRRAVAARYSWQDFSTRIYEAICDSSEK